MPSLSDAGQAWAAFERSPKMCDGGKRELEVMLKCQQGLLAQVQRGELRLVDSGNKIRRKIESIEAALEEYDKSSFSKRTQQMEQGFGYGQKPGANLPAKTGSSSLRSVDHTVPESIKGVRPSMDFASHMQIDEEPNQTEGSERNDRGKCEAVPTSSISGMSQSSQRDTDSVQSGKEEKEDWVAKRDKLRRKSETTSASPRTIVGNGKSVRLRSGLLEPAHERLPGEVVRETAERVREQIVKQVDTTADRLGQLLTIQEGGPMDTGPTDGPVNITREETGSGSGPQFAKQRTTKFISMEEAAGLERSQAEVNREVEDRILSRRPPPHLGPNVYLEPQDQDDNSLSEDTYSEASDEEETD